MTTQPARHTGFNMRSASTFRDRSRSHPVRAGAIAALAVVCILESSAQPMFRSEASLVALQVTVTDLQRRYVPDLRREDFSVLEEGRPQTVSLFAASTVPLDLMLLLDTSASMVGILSIARQAAVNFVRGLGPEDRAGVVVIRDRVQVARALTNETRELESAIEDAPIAGKTALYDALYLALKEFTRQAGTDYQMRRQAIIVFTDGQDNASHVRVGDLIEEARRSAVMIYAVVPVRQPAPGLSSPPARDWSEMRRLARVSGGRVFTPADVSDLAGAYEAITKELSHQYWLAFTPSTSARGFRRVAVRVVTRPSLRARTREGYYAGGSRRPVVVPPRDSS